MDSLGFEIHIMCLVKICCLAMGFRLDAHVDLTGRCKMFLADIRLRRMETRYTTDCSKDG